MRGVLICFEGIDYSGKSTLSRKVVNKLIDMNIPVLYIHYPKKKPDLTSSPDRLVKHFLREMADDRDAILDHIKHKGIVVVDRWFYSTLAYQGISEATIELIRNLNLPVPELIILLDADPAELTARRRDNPDAFEKRMELQRTVRTRYLQLMEKRFFGGRWFKLNALDPLSKKTEQVLKEIYAVAGI